MLQKSKSKSIAKFKYLIMVPLIIVMLTYVSCTTQVDSVQPVDDNSITSQVEKLKKSVEAQGTISEEEMAEIRKLIMLAYETSASVKAAQKGMENSVPFAVIEEVPVFPGCENLATNDEKKDCTSKQISDYVTQNFDTKGVEPSSKKGPNRVIVQFKIDETGNITNVRARAASPELEEEAKRVISSLPKMQPGKQRGKAVGVMYSLPIVYQINK